MEQKPELQRKDSDRVAFLFKSIHKVYKHQLYRKSRLYGFTEPQLTLLMSLHKKPFSTLNEMSDCLGLSKSTVSGIVDRLVVQGAVLREIPENNRRIVRLSLSPELQKNNTIQELKNKYINDIFKGASEEEMGKIISGLEILYTLVARDES